MPRTKHGSKLMVTLDFGVYGQIEKEANTRGITVQELLRAVIIPYWRKKHVLEISEATRQGYEERFNAAKRINLEEKAHCRGCRNLFVASFLDSEGFCKNCAKLPVTAL